MLQSRGWILTVLQEQGKTASSAGRRFHRQIALLLFRNQAGQIQADSCPFPGPDLLSPVKPLKNQGLLVPSHTYPLIRHQNPAVGFIALQANFILE